MVDPRRDHEALSRELERLASRMEALPVPRPDGADRLQRRRDWVVDTIRSYLIPRALEPAAPLVVVFAGPTGAGKSTLLNSVVGVEHSRTGPLRPTTSRPLVVTSEAWAERFRGIGGVECDLVTGRAPILTELALVDTPDIDSTSTEHRVTAETMIDHGDVVVFVTSAIRYADRVPWEVLRRAHSRSVPVIHVLNRVESRSSGAGPAYMARLAAEGLIGPVLTVPEYHLRPGGQSLPLRFVEELRDRLVDLVEERRSGATEVFNRVLDAVVTAAVEVTTVVSGEEAAFSEVRSRLHGRLQVQLGRIVGRMRPVRNEGLDLDRIGTLRRLGWAPAWAIRRRLPDPGLVAQVSSVLGTSLAAAIRSDLVDRIRRLPLETPGFGLERSFGGDIDQVVSRWIDEVRSSPPVATAVQPALAALLVEAGCLGVWPGEAAAALEALVGAGPGGDLCSRLAESLHRHLDSLYREVEELVLASLGSAGVAGETVEEVRATVSEVVAKASFADA